MLAAASRGLLGRLTYLSERRRDQTRHFSDGARTTGVQAQCKKRDSDFGPDDGNWNPGNPSTAADIRQLKRASRKIWQERERIADV